MLMSNQEQPWFDDYAEDEDDFQISEYDITSTRTISMCRLFSTSLNPERYAYQVFNGIRLGFGALLKANRVVDSRIACPTALPI